MINLDERDYLILALDVNNADHAEKLVKILSPEIRIFKVGLELFLAEGPTIFKRIRSAGAKNILLDLKLHDIPTTMRAAINIAINYGVELITCHCDQINIFNKQELNNIKILGITVLTSLNSNDINNMGYSNNMTNINKLALHRAKLAIASGCSGVVCSGFEANDIRIKLGPNILIICPGIRLIKTKINSDDQKRIVTPETAIKAGASHIVIGRLITKAPDPRQTTLEVIKSIKTGLKKI